MKYISTRGSVQQFSLREAAFRGLAPDGGLFMSAHIPAADMTEVEQLAGHSYNALAVYLAGLFFGDEMSRAQIENVVDSAYDFAPQLHPFGDNLYTLELFHGPTFAFKDFGARFMGSMFGVLNAHSERELIVLTATSGDTGSAVAGGFYNVPGVKVVLLYPAGRVSELQESQMTTLGGNIYPLRVAGSFDDCQTMAKAVFSDHAFCEERHITSANSINILRWIPQSFYYFYGWHQWRQTVGRGDRMPEIVVPSGNYGNLSAGMLAARMGLPVKHFVAASNANDVIPEFLKTGDYQPRESVHTVANAMDVGNPSNYERMMALCGGNFRKLQSGISGFSASDREIRMAIAEMWDKYHYLSDPHSAVGYLAAKMVAKTGTTTNSNAGGFWLSTAHEAKFREILQESLSAENVPQTYPPVLAERMELPRCYKEIPADTEVLREYITAL